MMNLSVTATAIVAFSLLTPILYSQVPSKSRQEQIDEYNMRVQTILEQSPRRRQEQRVPDSTSARTAVPPALVSNTQTTSSSRTTPDPIHDQNVNWQKFWDFYYQPDGALKKIIFVGQALDHSDDAIQLSWSLGPQEKSKEFDEESSATRKLVYKWLTPAGGGGAEQTPVELMLPPTQGTLYLRKGEECVSFSYWSAGINDVEIKRWRQPHDWKIATNITVPKPGVPHPGHAITENSYSIVITPNLPQMVNEWVYSIKDGTVYADKSDTTESLKIGSTVGDSRPVENMKPFIAAIDPVTSSILVEVNVARYPDTIFATDLRGQNQHSYIGGGTLEETIIQLGEMYGFNVEWADKDIQELAKQRKPPQNWKISDAVLYHISLALGRDFVPDVVSSRTLRIAASPEYLGNLETPKLREKLNADFKMETKLYSSSRISAETAAPLMKEMLSCYAVKAPHDTDNIITRGEYRSIVKTTLANELELKKQGGAENVKCETLIADKETNTLIVTATVETHEKMAAWLQRIDGTAKKTSLGPNEPAPERRRLQVVLLQGGKVGETAAGTSVTYSAAVPPQYGMSPDDLKVMGFDGAAEVGRGVVDLVASPGELGESTLLLGSRYPVVLTYRDERSPYLIVEAKLMGDANEPLAENTMMLEQGKPGFLGVTNLSGAVIMVLTWLGPAPASH